MRREEESGCGGFPCLSHSLNNPPVPFRTGKPGRKGGVWFQGEGCPSCCPCVPGPPGGAAPASAALGSEPGGLALTPIPVPVATGPPQTGRIGGEATLSSGAPTCSYHTTPCTEALRHRRKSVRQLPPDCRASSAPCRRKSRALQGSKPQTCSDPHGQKRQATPGGTQSAVPCCQNSEARPTGASETRMMGKVHARRFHCKPGWPQAARQKGQ